MKMLPIPILILMLLVPISGHSQHSDSLSTKQKIDTIFDLQKEGHYQQKMEPLHNKKFGIEINIARLLYNEKYHTFSGSVSLFDINRDAEIALPFYYLNSSRTYKFKQFTIDLHYRQFVENTQNGIYISAFIRLAQLSGYLEPPAFENPSTQSDETKIGFGFGVGYRVFSYKGLYWGTSFSLGRFAIGKSDIFYDSKNSFGDDASLIMDFELLKFGYAF